MSTPANSQTSRDSQPGRARASRSRLRPLRLTLLLLVLALVSLSEPRVFCFFVRQLLQFEAWRGGGTVQIARVEGSLFDPVRVLGSIWSYRSATGSMTRIEIVQATALLRWSSFWQRTSERWFERLSLDGVIGKVDLPSDPPSSEKARVPWFDAAPLQARWLPLPGTIEARDVDFLFTCKTEFVRLQKTRLRVSELAPGTIVIGRLALQQQWLQRSFNNVRGTTALQGSKVLAARLALAPEVEITNFSAELGQLAEGTLGLEAQLAAFGGMIRAQAATKPHTSQLDFEASGTFSQINIAQLATFLALSDAAGGTIKEGNFTFRGSPQDVTKSTTRLRVEATNFQWESRQWDSLVLGAELINQRLQIHDFILHQGHNELTANGEWTLPASGQGWWQSDFDWNVLAKIENLTELSALLLPEFRFAAGKLSVDGAVRRHGQSFEGKLDVNGNRLQWRNAPIDELHATVRLHRNELQISNFTLFNDIDSVRGSGVVNILGPTQYWGTLRAAVDDLEKYSAILQKPLVPEPLGGGAVLDWSGEGSAKGHSGKLSARLRKVRSLGANAAALHPINAELDANYAAGSVVFSRFVLADDVSSFTANIAVGNNALSLQGMQLRQNKQLTLEGDALLPLDVWKAWPNTSLETLLNDQVRSRVALNAYGLDLDAASKLTGWNFPIAGTVRGKLTAEGPLDALETSGQLTLTDGQLPLGWSGVQLRAVQAEAAFEGHAMTIAKLTGQHAWGDFRADGVVDLQDVRAPLLKFTVASENLHVPLFASEAGTPARLLGAAQVEIEGPLTSAVVRGTITAQNVRLASALELDPAVLWLADDGIELPAVFAWKSAPWNGWQLDLACATAEPPPDPAHPPISTIALHLGGTGGAPVLTGSIMVADFAAPGNRGRLSGEVNWNEGAVSIDAKLVGAIEDQPFVAQVFGPLQKPLRDYQFAPPLTEALIREALAGTLPAEPALPESNPLRLPPDSLFTRGIEVFEWAINNPDAPATSEVSAVQPPAPGTVVQ